LCWNKAIVRGVDLRGRQSLDRVKGTVESN